MTYRHRLVAGVLLSALSASCVADADSSFDPEVVGGKADEIFDCLVDPEHSLFIRDPIVVDDERSQIGGPWSASHLLQEMSPTGDIDDLGLYLRVIPDTPLNCTVGGSCQRPDDEFTSDLSTAPIRLVAIVARPDLVSESNPVGELRFVYQFFHELSHLTGPIKTGSEDPRLTTFLNFEYDLSRVRDENGDPIDRETWAQWFHELDELDLGSDAYLESLEQITQRVTGRSAAPAYPNGTALGVLRISADNWYPARDRWELRSMLIAPDDHPSVISGLIEAGQFISSGLDRTPPSYKNGWWNAEPYEPGQVWSLTAVLADNEAAILAGEFDFPTGGGQGFTTDPISRAHNIIAAEGGGNWMTRGGMYSHNSLPEGFSNERWDALTEAFGKLTCNGCHGVHTGTSGNHIEPRVVGEAAGLSAFVTETEIPRRVQVLKQLACSPE